MHKVDIAHLFNKTGSSYKLVILASRRAIELSEGAANLIDAAPQSKPMNVAIEEISQGKITYKINPEK